jgi:hypothetical protein
MLNKKASYLKTNKEQEERIKELRVAFSKMYDAIDNLCEISRETSLAITKLEEAQFWAIKGITREEEE